MAKTVSARDMLQTWRRPEPSEGDTEQLDDQSTSPLAERPASSPPEEPGGPEVAITSQDAPSPDARGNDDAGAAIPAAEAGPGPASAATPAKQQTYQRMTVFFTPDQRSWLRQTSRNLPEGLSTSDIVRLAINRLRREAESDLPLLDELVTQAHEEAGVLAGRRNRGLPTSP